MIASVISFMLLFPGTVGAAAREHLHGVVLGTLPKTGDLIVRHDPFGGMPGMTMSFRVSPPGRAKELKPGTVIDATVDTSHDPWTLSDITAAAAPPPASAPILRRVKPLRVGDLVPDTRFVDQRGRPFSFAGLRGQDVVLAFIYTRCRDPRMCPLISGKFHALQSAVGKRRVHLVEVTLDPAYDRPPVLARYGRMFDADPARWTLATGDETPTLDFAAQFGVTAFPDPQVGLIHAEDTVLIGPDGRIDEMISDTSWAPDEVVAQIDASRGLAANPIKRFDLWLSRKAVALCGNAVGGFSGLADLGIVIAIFAILGWCMWRLSRVFVENV